MKYTWLFLSLTACAPPASSPEDLAQQARFAAIRAQYPTTTIYSPDGLTAHGVVTPAVDVAGIFKEMPLTRPGTKLTPDDLARVMSEGAQYPATTTYSDGYADGCLAGAGGPQLKRQLDAEYSKGWKAGKRSCKANYDRALREMTE